MTWSRFLWSYIAYRKDLLAILLACAMVMGLAELSIPWLIKEIVDAVLDATAHPSLNAWLAVILGILAVLYVAHVVLLRAEARMILHCSYHFRARLFAHIHEQALPFFQRHRTGELMHRATSDTRIVENETAKLFRDVPGELLVVIGVTVLMFLLHAGLALLVIAFIASAAAVTTYLGQPLPSLRKSAQRLAARMMARFQDGIVGMRTVQAFTNEPYELARLDADNRSVRDVEMKEGMVYALMEPLGDMIELLGLVLVVWYGGHLILADKISAGTLVAFIAYMEILTRPLAHVEDYYRSIQSIRAVGERLQELFADREVLPARGDHRSSGDPPALVIEDVSFHHADAERNVLRGVSFAVRPGELVAVAGRNGAGKSTLMDLLLRFYDPTEGRVLADGIDLRAWNLRAWRRSAGVMSQDVFLFHGTIIDNVAYGRPEASKEEIEDAVGNSGLERILRRLPKGLDTIVGERGTQLSGGERQSIAIARLFLRKPKLLILDEPTSHLDGEALQLIGAALQQLMRESTTFLVSHSGDAIQQAGRVLFLEGGQLADDGPHEVLFQRNARYRALWREPRERARPSTKQPKRTTGSGAPAQ